MAQKLETGLELKSSAEQFLSLWKGRAHQVPDHTPSNIHAVHVHEGDWETSGCVLVWKYTIGGKKEEFKEKLIVDDENKKVTLIGLEGDVFNIYKVYNCIWELTPKPQGSSTKVTLEYEKLNESVPAPDIYMDFVIKITKDMDQGINKASK
ncbi:MLP-like protein 328 isoform X1 [Mercurialis annua]|uniref:MLP-like protein 328 isoform X1 n=1 Tax=Mercurialis annua TaxID=3986 RepID=UPI002160753E|nr:MLP-like protein 328 isoform X1 [Mercurialis annua]